MKQSTDQQERNEDKKKPEKENPSHGIDPEPKEPEMEVDQGSGERQKRSADGLRWPHKSGSAVAVPLWVKQDAGLR